MKRRMWAPINPDGTVNDAELSRPWDTAEPTMWEAIAPKVGNGYAAFIAGALRRAELCPHHRFWLLFGGRMPVSPFPENVTIAAGPIASQAEADRVLPALLAVKAARREAVFAPREAIRLLENCTTGTCKLCGGDGEITDPAHWAHPLNTGDGEDETWCLDCESGHIQGVDAVRVRGGDAPLHPTWVRLLRDQAKNAGVPFSLSWGEWAPVAMPNAWFDGSRAIAHVSGEVHPATWADVVAAHGDWHGFERWGSARTGCSLDGDDYPEVDL